MKRITWITSMVILITGVNSFLLTQSPTYAQSSCPVINNTPFISYAYGSVTANGLSAPPGTVVEVRNPRGDPAGCWVVSTDGNYGAMPVYGEDLSVSPTIAGMRSNEAVSFYINGAPATASPGLTWSSDKTPHAINLSGNGTLVAGHINLQGRPAAPNSRWQVLLTVNVYQPGVSSPLYQFTPVTDDTGEFFSFWLDPGSYDIAVKNSHTLQNVQTVTLINDTNMLDFGTLREGDANNDNFVTIIDFSYLVSGFGICQGMTGYDEHPDFNEDNCVNIADFSLLVSNFGQAGAQTSSVNLSSQNVATPAVPLESLAQDISTQASDVFLKINPDFNQVQVNDIFTVTLRVESGTQQMTGLSAYINFDPAILQVQAVTQKTGQPFQFNLAPTSYNNTAGTIDFSVGSLFGPFPAGSFDLLDIRLQAIANTQETQLSFNMTDPRKTDVVYLYGESVLTPPPLGSTIAVSDPTAITLVNFAAAQGSQGVTVTWETGTEINNAGFNLYRATAEAGPFAKINDLLIPAKGDPVSGASYVYLDPIATDPNQTYYYKLEDIDTGGSSTFHGPVNTASDVSGEPEGTRVYLPIVLK